MLRDAPSQQSDGHLAAGALEHLVTELQTLRDEIERAASSTSDMARHLRELLDDQGHMIGAPSRSVRLTSASAGPTSACAAAASNDQMEAHTPGPSNA
jgi:hypothetical protein